MQLLFSGVPNIPRSLPRPGKAQAVTRAWYNANSALWKDRSSRNMDALRNRLTSLRPAIEDILARTGTAGLTYGIIYRDDVMHTENFGYSDVEQKVPVDEETIFQVASLTKNMVAALVGMLVNEDKLRWDQPINEILPDWNVQDSTVRNQTTIVDCLAHRTGLQMNNYWLASNNNIIIPPEKSIDLINGLKAVKPFRGQFQYNNLGYEIASHATKELTGSPWNELLQSRILDPLQMKRTGTNQNFAGPDNVSKAYGALSTDHLCALATPRLATILWRDPVEALGAL